MKEPDVPQELADALQADAEATHAFAAVGRHGRAAKCNWVRRALSEAEKRDRALQVTQELKAHEASRRRNRAYVGDLSAAVLRARNNAQKG